MTIRAPLTPILTGCTIVVAADRRAGDLVSALERRGGQAYRAPALSIIPNEDDDILIARTRDLIADPPDVLIVTTGVGFRGWIDAAHENDLAEALSSALAKTQFVARGPKAHGAIQQAGFTADWVAESETSAEVGEYLATERVAGRRIAIQHHGAGADGLDTLLSGLGADVVSLTVYRWGPPPDPQIVQRSVVQAGAGEVDAVLFTSAPGAAEWVRAAARADALDAIRRRAASGRLLLAAVGPITAAPLEDAQLQTTLAARGRLGSLVRCVVDHYASGAAPRLRTALGTMEMRSGGVFIDEAFVPLSRAGASILSELFDAAGRVLSREELGLALPRGGESAHAVEMAVARLREALGGAGAIQTIVKRGYRLTVGEPR
ncbi:MULTISPECIES: uroporphyrinogen-III synthase [unclassified Microbacterium]|uniref:uroporphyrinogen-III synthase n=1 Tax=unclassified Microbacterium TaxID=2609290 RepID=UPI000CFE18CD|nr:MULTISPECIES: uroporphyrinogen-III synthase [unclassified Microbacterium]PQZ60999.1 uroporphyrinogen-III synthase [Microbacterium sp. MYb43]PQZ82208.1 uroporphyrinogen-III synthase [Microbacterium sp. MYb40]PRB24091.1 uroporphyrinogen-III synthase [Microbacterium sp. MYb54]PRB30922.1 uroporphyrinogen-III synthase [Microbacterium sp. MYb50]PRB70656.1 uroporphyrinogen-III synthase [Microbacterium sp. MYb24]